MEYLLFLVVRTPMKIEIALIICKNIPNTGIQPNNEAKMPTMFPYADTPWLLATANTMMWKMNIKSSGVHRLAMM